MNAFFSKMAVWWWFTDDVDGVFSLWQIMYLHGERKGRFEKSRICSGRFSVSVNQLKSSFKFYFHHTSVPIHPCWKIVHWILANKISGLFWLVRSLDLNLIE